MQSGNFKMPSADAPHNLETGRNFYNQGQFAESVPYFEAALRAVERTHGHDAPELAEYLQELGDAYAGADRASESLEIFDRLFRIGERIIGGNHPQIITILWKMSILAERVGREEDSYEMISQALTRARAALRPDDSLATQVVERYNYLSDLMRQVSELKRRGEYVEHKPEPPAIEADTPAEDYQYAMNAGDIERSPFSQPAGPTSRASLVNLDPLSSEAVVLDSALMAQNARPPVPGHLTGSSVLGHRASHVEGDESDYSIAEIENLTGRRTPKVVHGDRGRSRKLSASDDRRVILNKIARDYLLPVGAIAVVAAMVAFAWNRQSPPAPASSTHATGNTVSGGAREIYETGDGLMQIRLLDGGEALLVKKNAVTPVRYERAGNDWGSYFKAMSASVSEKQIWLDQKASGLVSEDKVEYYGTREPERRVIEKMHYLAGLAQGSFLHTGSYPLAPPVGASREFSHNNPFSGQVQLIAVRQMPLALANKEELKTLLSSGTYVLNEAMQEPGQIACYSLVDSSDKQKSTAFFVRGLDRTGKFIGSSTPGGSLVIEASPEWLYFKPLFREVTETKIALPEKKVADKKTPVKNKTRGKAVAKVESKPVVEKPYVAAEDVMLKSAAQTAADKNTCIWIMPNAPLPLALLHHLLPAVLGFIGIIMLVLSRLEAVDIKGQSVGQKNHVMLAIAVMILFSSLGSLVLQLTVFK